MPELLSSMCVSSILSLSLQFVRVFTWDCRLNETKPLKSIALLYFVTPCKCLFVFASFKNNNKKKHKWSRRELSCLLGFIVRVRTYSVKNLGLSSHLFDDIHTEIIYYCRNVWSHVSVALEDGCLLSLIKMHFKEFASEVLTPIL